MRHFVLAIAFVAVFGWGVPDELVVPLAVLLGICGGFVLLRHSDSQGADRKPQPPTRSIVGGPGEDQSEANP